MGYSKWEEVKLGDVAEVLSGYAFKTKDFVEAGIPVVKIKNIIPPVVDISDTQYVSQELYRDKIKYSLEFNDILISMTGSHINQLASAVGKIGRVKLLDQRLLLNQRVGKLYVKDCDRCSQEYLYYFLTQDNIRYDLAASAGGSANQANISPQNIKDIDMVLPPLQEQKAIANILSSLDEKIELNNQMNKTLEEMAQALFKRWFVDFEFPNEDGEPYKSSGGEMVDSELGMMPKGWVISTLSDLCSLETKSEKPFDNTEVVYEHFSLPACDEGKLPAIEMGSEISSNKYKIDNECILISKLNPATKRIWNPTCLTENAICSTEFMVYRPKKAENKSFCYEIINADRFTEFLLANVTGSTSSRQRTQPKKTLEYKIPTGDNLTIEKFSKVVRPIHEVVKNNIENNKFLRAKRDALLPKLISGEIRVTDLQN